MRTLLLITGLLFAQCTFAQWINLKYNTLDSANVMVTYKLKYQQDSTDASNIRSSTLVLFIGNNISKFVNKTSYINDTTCRRFTTDAQAINFLTDPKTPHAAIRYQIYKNYPKGKMTFTDFIPSDTYKFEEPLDMFHWTLSGDTGTVCGYKVQKATCNFGGRSWIAWFSPDLPYSDGPNKFNGLPGLIVQVYDTRNHYDFELKSINKLVPALITDIKDEDNIITTKQGYFKALDSFRADIMSRAKAAGINSDAQQIMAKNMAADNNPLELIRK